MLANMFKKNWFRFFKVQNTRECSVGLKENFDNLNKMKSWQVHSYGEDLILSTPRIPIINDPHEVLIKVEAASINPIDSDMQDGYGRSLLQVLRHFEMELPLTLGRDFCGTIVAKGIKANNRFQVGDRVYGCIPVHKQGSFAEYVLAEDKHICHPPEFVKPFEATSIVYTGLTAWSALFIYGNLLNHQPKNLRVLILGASGGVGTMAIQILKSMDATVVGTCSTDAIPLVTSLGIDKAYDYTQSNYKEEISNEDSFHIILDCAKFGPPNIPPSWKFKSYIGLNSFILSNADQHGLVMGSFYSIQSILCDTFKGFKDGKSIKWAFFTPSNDGLNYLNNLLQQNKIRPIIQKEYDFSDLPKAMDHMKKGHLRDRKSVV